jgi:hypothetical protein
MEHVPEVRPRLGLARVRPQEEGEALPRLGRLPVEQEVREERLGAGGFERGQRRFPEPELQLAEEADAKDGRVDRDALLGP